MQGVAENLIPVKFFALTTEGLLMALLFLSMDDNIYAGIPIGSDYDSDAYNTAWAWLLVGLLFCAVFLLVEIVLMFIGVSIMFNWVSAVSVMFHSLGILFKIWYFMLSWNYRVIWLIFGLTSVVPFAVEIGVLVNTPKINKAKN